MGKPKKKIRIESFPDRMLTLNQASEYLNINRSTLWVFVKRGELRGYKLGPAQNSRTLFRKTDLDAWLETKRVIPDPHNGTHKE